MCAYLRRRILASVVPLFAVLFGVFAIARLSGNPAALYLPNNATEEMRNDYAERHGFNDSLFQQLGGYLKSVATLDLGKSLRTGEDAMDMVLRAFPVTLQLAALTMAVAITFAVVVGSLAALRPNGVFDRISSFLSLAAASIPDFWLGIVGIWVLAITLGLVPTSGMGGPASWLLPLLTLCFRPLGVLVQFVRGSMIATLSSPYVKLGRSKGASEWRVVRSHALRNASAPALTVAGDLAVGLVNGAVVVETLFGWPGIGKLMIDSITGRDFAVLQAAVLFTALSVFLLNIVIDIIYALLDPRARPAARTHGGKA